jgi:hypothetical protein
VMLEKPVHILRTTQPNNPHQHTLKLTAIHYPPPLTNQDHRPGGG